jgi:hypothetical protein
MIISLLIKNIGVRRLFFIVINLALNRYVTGSAHAVTTLRHKPFWTAAGLGRNYTAPA